MKLSTLKHLMFGMAVLGFGFVFPTVSFAIPNYNVETPRPTTPPPAPPRSQQGGAQSVEFSCFHACDGRTQRQVFLSAILEFSRLKKLSIETANPSGPPGLPLKKNDMKQIIVPVSLKNGETKKAIVTVTCLQQPNKGLPYSWKITSIVIQTSF